MAMTTHMAPKVLPILAPKRPPSILRDSAKRARGKDRIGTKRTYLEPDYSTDPNRARHEDPFGHHMVKTGILVWCAKCGAYATDGSHGRYLRQRCRGPLTNGLRNQRNMIMAGYHPSTGERLA